MVLRKETYQGVTAYVAPAIVITKHFVHCPNCKIPIDTEGKHSDKSWSTFAILDTKVVICQECETGVKVGIPSYLVKGE